MSDTACLVLHDNSACLPCWALKTAADVGKMQCDRKIQIIQRQICLLWETMRITIIRHGWALCILLVMGRREVIVDRRRCKKKISQFLLKTVCMTVALALSLSVIGPQQEEEVSICSGAYCESKRAGLWWAQMQQAPRQCEGFSVVEPYFDPLAK